MARRLEIIVPGQFSPLVKDVLNDPLQCNLGPDSPEPGLVFEMAGSSVRGNDNVVFQVTVPGKKVGKVMRHLNDAGFGTAVGIITLCTLDALKPRFKRIIPGTFSPGEDRSPRGTSYNADSESGLRSFLNTSPESFLEKKLESYRETEPFRGYKRPPLTVEEVYANIVAGAQMTATTWINLIGSSIICAGGAAADNQYFVVASMLVSPLMGPILGIVFGYQVADWKLFYLATKNLFVMSCSSFMVGFLACLPLGLYDRNRWSPDNDIFDTASSRNTLVYSVFVSAAVGVIVGNAVLKAR
jgi:hypothetical protein